MSEYSQHTNCSVCDSSELGRWGKKNGYELYCCSKCSHRFADLKGAEFSRNDPALFRHELTHGLMTSDDAYYSHLKEGELPGHATYITATYAINICRLYGTSTGTWMDVGCGSGHLLSRARDNGYAVIGIEPGGWGQLAAAEKQLNIIRGFLTKKTFGERFAVVSATDVIEHVSDPVGFLRILRHYINVNGVLVFSIPFSDSFERRVLGTKWNMVEPPTHSQFFSRLSLTTALEKAGLRLIRSRQFSVRPFFGLGNISWIRSGIDALFDGPQIVAIAKPI